MSASNLFDNMFLIRYRNGYIVYLPLHGIILESNSEFVNLLNNAKQGDAEAQVNLGIENILKNNVVKNAPTHYDINGKAEVEFTPSSFSLFLTSSCTMRCGYCYAEGGAQDTQMPWEMVTGVLDLAVRNVVSQNKKDVAINFHGGGDISAAWPLLVKTREYLKSLETKYSIVARTSVGTNGVLNYEQRQWIIDNIDTGTVSMDGPIDIQDTQRPLANGEGSYKYVFDTMKVFDSNRFSYGLRATVTSQSVKRLEEIVLFFCENFKVKEIKAEPMYAKGRGRDATLGTPDPSEFVEHFRRASEIADRFGRRLSYSGARYDVLTDVFCQAAGDSCAITPEGWVTSCYEVLDKNDPMSELFFYGRFNLDTNTIEINNDKLKDLRSLSVWHKSYCDKCFCKWHCAGDCPVKSIHDAGKNGYHMSDRCYINRELTKDQLIKALNAESLSKLKGLSI